MCVHDECTVKWQTATIDYMERKMEYFSELTVINSSAELNHNTIFKDRINAGKSDGTDAIRSEHSPGAGQALTNATTHEHSPETDQAILGNVSFVKVKEEPCEFRDHQIGVTVDDQIGSTIDDQIGGTVDDQIGGTVDDQIGGTIDDQIGGTVDDQIGSTVDVRTRETSFDTYPQTNMGELNDSIESEGDQVVLSDSTVYSQKLYKCAKCNIDFMSPRYLSKHMRACHMLDDVIDKVEAGGVRAVNGMCATALLQTVTVTSNNSIVVRLDSIKCEEDKNSIKNEEEEDTIKSDENEDVNQSDGNEDVSQSDVDEVAIKSEEDEDAIKSEEVEYAIKIEGDNDTMDNQADVKLFRDKDDNTETPKCLEDVDGGCVTEAKADVRKRTHNGQPTQTAKLQMQEMAYPCLTCEHQFITEGGLYNHMTSHSADVSYKAKYICPVCDKVYKIGTSLTKHFNKNHSAGDNKCKVCLQLLTGSTNVIGHLRTHPPCAEKSEAWQRGTQDLPYPCVVCEKEYTTLNGLWNHLTSHPTVIPHKHMYECPVCEKHYAMGSALTKHYKNQHTSSSFGSNKCRICLQQLPATVNVIAHLRTHCWAVNNKDTNKEYKCTECRRVFVTAGSLARHMRRHGKNYHCTICGAAFNTSDACTAHNQTHKMASSLQCTVCHKNFTLPASLTKHMKRHPQHQQTKASTTSVATYKCNLCQKEFKHKCTLTIHMRHHTGDRPFECLLCNKRFISSGERSSHIKSHTGEKPYKCDLCGKGFAASRDFTKHRRIHSGEKPYQCPVCLKDFNQSSNLNRHLSLHKR